ncbi:MAG: transposase [Palaeococcus sp.]|uniref:IS1/IS1595 family N-terminal zinc-binding domain-containing protein n=1 Tax=Palaeococcus sp. (in: euryarchaeotes) TaxID=2820298 RepID=UPI0034502D82|nr:transposase [Palaeococcus sp. (in: euryarchaeotes)]
MPDTEECYRIIRQTRWPEGVICPYCGSKEVQKNGYTPKGAQKYHCKNCGKYFNDLTGTKVRKQDASSFLSLRI